MAIECSASGREIGDAELRAVLEEAMPVYRRQWWPGHHAGNAAWISAQLDELKSYEERLTGRLAEAYGAE